LRFSLLSAWRSIRRSLELVYWLEDNGYPAIIVPPSHVDPWTYDGDPDRHLTTLLSLPHAAVEAGLGTLGLNLQLLTPEFGPRVLLTAVLCSVDVACDSRMETALCLGPSCGRCLKTCPADAVGHWIRDWPACDRFRSPHGFAQLSEHVTRIIAEPDAARQKEWFAPRTASIFGKAFCAARASSPAAAAALMSAQSAPTTPRC
jgi:epoxyqueuosine reductase